jgi:hypothetical protein
VSNLALALAVNRNVVPRQQWCARGETSLTERHSPAWPFVPLNRCSMASLERVRMASNGAATEA